MLHLTGRTDLILYCRDRAPSRGIQRAMVSGTVEVLGWFDTEDPSTSGGGWVLKITSVNKTTWYLRLTPVVAEYTVEWIGKPDWNYWAGNSSDPRWTLRSGDNPEEYGRLRDAAITATARRNS